jgi:hypothetical protein
MHININFVWLIFFIEALTTNEFLCLFNPRPLWRTSKMNAVHRKLGFALKHWLKPTGQTMRP